MTKAARNILVCAVLLAVIGAGGWVAFSKRGVQRVLVQKPAVAGRITATASSTEEKALADAIALLPEQGDVAESERINDHGFWIRQKFTTDVNATSGDVEMDKAWYVDVNSKKATLLEELSFGFPGAELAKRDGDDLYVIIAWGTGWEGASMHRLEYIDRNTGELAYVFEEMNGQALSVQHAGKELTIALAPVDACQGATYGKKVNVKGIDVNGTLIKLPEAKMVECSYVEMLGDAFYPDLRGFSFSEDHKIISVVLPWYEVATIPADSLDIGQIKFLSTSGSADGVDMSNWNTFRNEHLGFEAKYPADWSIQNVQEETTGTDKIRGKGFAYFGLLNQEYLDPNMMNFDVQSFESELDLKQFEKINDGKNSPDADGDISDLSHVVDALDSTPSQRSVPSQGWIYCRDVVIKAGNRYFDMGVFLDGESKKEIDRHIGEFKVFLRSFKVLQ